MELKPGYKQTDLGIVPESWCVDGLGDFWSITDCKHITARFVASGYPLASIREVQSQYLNFEGAKQTTRRFYSLLIEGGRKPRPGDLIMSRNATVGEVAQVADWHPEFAMGQDVCLLRKKSESLSTDYMQSVFWSSIIKSQILDLMVGSTFKRVNIQQIRNLIVPIPPTAEQQSIAEALSDTGALIESLEQLLSKKRQLKQGVMQELLSGRCRLPGFSGDWELRSMNTLGHVYGGLTGKTKKDFGHGQSQYIPFMNVMSSTVIDPDWLEPVFVSLAESQNKARKGDLFFNGSSETPEEVGYCSVLRDDISSLYLNSFCFGFRFFAEIAASGLFLAYWFRSKAGRKAMSVLAQGATRYNIAKSAFLRLKIPFPGEKEQIAIAEFLSGMDGDTAALETQLQKVRQLKQGMMQELLTGRTRLV